MKLLLVSLVLLLVSAGLCAFSKNNVYRRWVACGGVFAGSMIGLVWAVRVLVTGTILESSLGSPIPGLTLALGVDALSAFFLVAIFGLSAVVALYAWDYVRSQKKVAATLPHFPLLVACMALVCVARDGFFFLICWEIMSLASFFLVTTEHEDREVRHAGFIYLVATHLATAFLMAFFALLARESGSFLFADFKGLANMTPIFAGTLFIFAVVGFGTKAGIFPFHVWLPHAHPAAPSYVSALMSGVMIKTGIYGLLRALTFLPPPPAWWGLCLLIFGLLSALMGILHGALQRDYKRLLAYSSVENIGIMFIGMGLGMLGISFQKLELVFLGFGGALFHLWSHALFKGALFLGAGLILHATHSRMLDQLGGLFKKRPLLGWLILFLAMAIAGLPPLNGFIGEVLIYIGLFESLQTFTGFAFFMMVAAIIGLAFAGALTIMAFTKFFGMIFLGEARSEKARMVVAERFSPALGACLLLVILCGAMVIFAAPISAVVALVPSELYPSPMAWSLHGPTALLVNLGRAFLIFLASLFLCWLLFRIFSKQRSVKRVVTWDCGFANPSPRMQYSGSSFVEPLLTLFAPLLRQVTALKKITGFFPTGQSFDQQTNDLTETSLIHRIASGIDSLFTRVRNLQRGRIQEYLALIFGTLVTLLLWEVWIGI